MAFVSDLRSLWQPGGGATQSSRTEAALRGQTEAFCAATTLASQTDCLIELFSGIWQQRSERAYQSRLVCWLGMLEQDADLRSRFQQGWQSTLGLLDSVSFFAEAGIPAQHALFREITSRIFQRWLPPPRAEDDTARLFAAVFCSSRAVAALSADGCGAVYPPGCEISGARKASLPIPMYTRTSTKHSACWQRASLRVAPAVLSASVAPPDGGAISSLCPGLRYRKIH